MTKFGQTHGFSALDHITALEKYLGEGVLDYYLVDKAINYQTPILRRYKKENAFPVKDDLGKSKKVVRRSISSGVIYKKHEFDGLKRSLIRHDSRKLAKAIIELL